MAMDDRRDGFASTTATTKIAPTLTSRKFTVEKTIDCLDDDVTNGDVVQAIYIPPGYYIQNVGLIVERAEGGTLTVDVGLYAESNDAETDKDGFLDGVDCNATAGTAYCSSPGVATTGSPCTWVTAYGTVGYYTSAGQNLCILFNNAADYARLTVVAELLDLTSKE